MGEVGVGEAGADQRVLEMRFLADAQAAVVEVGTTSLGGGKEVVAGRVVDYRLAQNALVQQGDGNRILRKVVEKVGGAIERVDDPLVFGFAAHPALFC